MHFSESITRRHTRWVSDNATKGEKHERRTADEADGVVDHVDALAAGELHDLLLPSLFRVVHAVVRAAVADGDVDLLLRARGRDDLRAQRCARRRQRPGA